jgi:putative peptide zinc metalloprotease protein
MNLTQALNAALPEIPARIISRRCPRMPTDAVAKEHIESGQPVVRVLVPSQEAMYRFSPANWALIQFFDGVRTYEEVAELYSAQLGAEYGVDDVREFAASLEAIDFWYKTPQEKNILYMQQTAEGRKKLLKSRKNRYGDLSQIMFPAVNPDPFLTWLHRYTSFMYSWWFTLLTLGLFAAMAAITVTHWSEIGRDSLQFFNFTKKSWGDVGVFYILAVVTMCWHEIGHGHACKHFGARVPSMGFLLIYLTPAFYTDTSEAVVKASSGQNFIISLAGVWSELLICAVATIVWWGTPPDTTVHSVAYMLVLITGIASVMINWNPLIKLDGYYMLCEILELPELKESATLYVSAWVKRNIWRLPVEVPYVPKRRRLGYAVYALLSGAYSYTVLFVLARFVGNVFRNFNPDWSFVPELGTAAIIFRSRIRTLVNFMKLTYLDKKDRVHAWLGSRQFLGVAAASLVFLTLPLWRDSVLAPFVLEPQNSVTIRASVPGIVDAVYSSEGRYVAAGAPVASLRNLSLQSKLESSTADYKIASMRATSAELRYADVGGAIQQRNQAAQQSQNLAAQALHLTLLSPISGVVLTPRLADREGAFLREGAALAEIADLSLMRARIYVSEYDVSKVKAGANARASIEGRAQKWTAKAIDIAPVSSLADPSLTESSKYKGLVPPHFYCVQLLIPNSEGVLKPGMRGTARIYGRRRSVLGLGWEAVAHFFGRKLW